MKKFDANKVKRRSLFIAYTAILIAINVALKFLSIQLGALSISFTYIPCFIAGIFLGPISGGMVGLIGDLIGTFAKSLAPSPLITLSCTLIGVIPGLVFMIKKINPYIKLGISAVLVLFICTLGLSSYGNWLIYSSGAGAGAKSFGAYWLVSRLPKQPIVVLVNTVILYLIYYPMKKFIFDKMNNKTTSAQDIEQLATEGSLATIDDNATTLTGKNMPDLVITEKDSKIMADSTSLANIESNQTYSHNMANKDNHKGKKFV